MRIYLIFALLLISGCQSLNDHLYCEKLVDTNMPKVIQKKYSGDMVCNQTMGYGFMAPQLVCSPAYEEIISNKFEREQAYKNCRNRRGGLTQSNYINDDSVRKSQAISGYCRSLLMNNDRNSSIYRSQCE